MEKDLIDRNYIIFKNKSIGTLMFSIYYNLVIVGAMCMGFFCLYVCIMEIQFLGCLFCLFCIFALFHELVFNIIFDYREVQISKDGYQVKLFFIKKYYLWKDVRTKMCEDFKYKGHKGVDYPKVKRNVIFCNEVIHKSKSEQPINYMRKSMYFSFFSILLTDEETANEKNYSVNYFRMDEREFKKIMNKWNIEIDGL